ncbi:MAG: hypothetical protein ACR2RE_11620 [Geminicoccaceae bacterium]
MPAAKSDLESTECAQLSVRIHPRFVPFLVVLTEFREAARRDKPWVQNEDPASERMCALEAEEESSLRIVLQSPVIPTMVLRYSYRDPGMQQLRSNEWYGPGTRSAFNDGQYIEPEGTRSLIYIERDVLDHLLSQIDFIRKSNGGRPRRIIGYDRKNRPLLKFLDQMTEAEKRAADENERKHMAQRVFDQPPPDLIEALYAGPALPNIDMPGPGGGDGDPVGPAVGSGDQVEFALAGKVDQSKKPLVNNGGQAKIADADQDASKFVESARRRRGPSPYEDDEHLDTMLVLLQSGECRSIREAAGKFADKAQGNGTPENKQKRLQSKFRKKYPEVSLAQ